MKSKAVLLALMLLAQFATSAAHAASNLFRSYLSVDGNDSNPCTVTAPCRLLPAALAATQTGGEVWILDSANYNTGAVTITQSVAILAVPGVLGSLLADNGDAVDVTGAGIVVTFHNMDFREFGSGGGTENIGVNSTGADTQIILENSEFSGFPYAVVVGGAGTASATITHSTFRNNVIAILINADSGNLGHAVVDQCTIINSQNIGVFAAFAQVVVSNSSITGSGQNSTNNGFGFAVAADSNGVIALQNDVIEYNLVGADITNDADGSLGIVESNGNNTLLFNSSDVSGGSLTKISTK